MSAFREALEELPDAVFADVLEGEDAYLVVLDISGATPDDIDVSVDHGLISVRAECKTESPDGFESLVEDRSEGVHFELPVPLDGSGEHASGTLERGVLELTVPKHEHTAETTIPVSE